VILEIPFPRIDPVLLDLPGPLDLRWYGLGYVVAFAAGAALMRRLAREGFVPMKPEAVGDLVFALVLGVILGGRIGYILFYEFDKFAAHPMSALRIWEGGLSFHGGLIGAVAAAYLFARPRGIPFLRLGDGLVLVVPVGIFAVRIANFINGELYGRITDASVPWAMRFPTDPQAQALLGIRGGGLRERELAIRQAYDSGAWERVRPQVPLRHPSQIYEALGEGLLLGLLLWAVYRGFRARGRTLAPGALGGLFLAGYGAVRTVIELFRQPDAQFVDARDRLGTVLGPLTMGQTLSLLMVLAGATLLLTARRRAAAST
jgi:phosphatidylglycerol:prolipoprotein diacylglycerol transferase